MPTAVPRSWDLFCRLLDNFGDVGVCWRLAADLAARGHRVRLWADDPSPLRFMAPQGAPGIEVLTWPADDTGFDWPQPCDVVIETFGCELPARFVARMAARPQPPVWLNLEYLGTETFAERSHGLPSPQRNGLAKWFFFPGFSARTGGLLREPGLIEARACFDRDAWLAAHGLSRRPDERIALLFCYENPALASVLQGLADRPTLLLLTPGHAQRQVQALDGQLPASMRTADLAWLPQAEFDRALWCGDVNFIRGEDSLVRAVWAGVPFLWQLYPQEAEVREVKLAALLGLLCEGADDAALAGRLLRLQRHYNGLGDLPGAGPVPWPALTAWEAQVKRWRDGLAAQSDLVSRLERFVDDKS